MLRARRVSVFAVAIAASLGACSPALDWREVRPEGGELATVFPCRPDRYVRRVELAGAPVSMHLHACEAEGITFALAFADVDAPAKVGAALGRLRELAAANIGAAPPPLEGWRLAGMTPHAQAGRLAATGRLPDGAAVRLQAVVFSKGLRVFQATVLGAALPDDAVQPFWAGLKLSS